MGFKSFIGKQKENIKDRLEVAKAERQADREARRSAASEARQAAREERRTQTIKVAVAKEKHRGSTRLKQIQTGGSQFGSFINTLAPPQPRRAASPRRTKKKGKKRKARRAAPQRQEFNMFGNGGFV